MDAVLFWNRNRLVSFPPHSPVNGGDESANSRGPRLPGRHARAHHRAQRVNFVGTGQGWWWRFSGEVAPYQVFNRFSYVEIAGDAIDFEPLMLVRFERGADSNFFTVSICPSFSRLRVYLFTCIRRYVKTPLA